jgi:hypothetical protein
MTYWFLQAAANAAGPFVWAISIGVVAAPLVYVAFMVRAWIKRLLEQASFMVPHHIGISSVGRSASPGIYVIVLRRGVIVGYAATDIKDADHVCKMSWLRRSLKALFVDDVPVWNGITEIAAREADPSERIRFIKALQIYNGSSLGEREASELFKFVLVDRSKRRVVKIGYGSGFHP